ncbi:MAG: hypothetical protein CMF74_10050 [Maricaulis sp.]|nr:hypothetical protein [Maricaulis sp.]
MVPNFPKHLARKRDQVAARCKAAHQRLKITLDLIAADGLAATHALLVEALVIGVAFARLAL